WVADTTGMGRSVEGKLLLGHAQQGVVVPGDGRQIDIRPARMRQPISGPGRPRIDTSASGWAEVGVDLAGDVTLQAADDRRLGLSLLCAALDVGAGGRV